MASTGFMCQKSGPAFDAGSLRGVERLPLGTDRPAAYPHAGLVRCPVPFAGVAPLAGGHAVGPARRSPLRLSIRHIFFETVATLPGDLGLMPIPEALKSPTSRTGGKPNLI